MMKIMNRKNIIIAILLMLGATITDAQTIKVNETKASANNDLEIKVVAEATIGNYIAAGFCIELPEGFSVNGVECVKGDDVQSNHVVRVGQAGDSKLRVAVYSLSNSAFDLRSTPQTAGPGQSGGGGGGGRTARKKAPGADEENISLSLCTLKLKSPNTIGEFKGNLSGVEFATSSHSLVTSNAVSFNIILNGKGDVNGTGTVDAQDVVDLVLYMIGKKNLDFNAADVNGDGVVNSADVIMISNAILK